MSSKYNQPPSYQAPIQPPAPAHSNNRGEAAGYYEGAQQNVGGVQQYGSPAPYNQGYPPMQPYGQQYGPQYPQPGPPYQQPYGSMQYQQPPPQGYYADDRGYGSRGGAGSGICAGLLGACAALAICDLCLIF